MGKIITCNLEPALIESLSVIKENYEKLELENVSSTEELIGQLERRDALMESILLKLNVEESVDLIQRIRSEDHDVGIILIAKESCQQEIQQELIKENILIPRLFYCEETVEKIIKTLQQSLIATWRRRSAELVGVRTRLSEERSERLQLREQLSKANQGLRSEIRQRRQVQLALETERDMLLTMIDNIPDVVFVKDINSRFLITNSALRESMAGGNAEDYIGKTDFDFYSDDIAAGYFAEEQEIIQTGKQSLNIEQQLLKSSGEEAWLLVTKMPVTDKENKTIGLVGICRDITQRKKVLQQIHAAEKRFEDLYESSPDMCLTVDLEGKIIECNQTLIEKLGYERNEILEKSIYDFYEADCIHQVREADEVFIQQGKVENIELAVICKNSTNIEISLSATAFRDPRGEIKYSRSVWRDISHRKIIEAELEEERKLLRTLIDLIPSRIFVKDSENRYKIVNKAHMKMLGAKERKEVLNKQLGDFIHSAYVDQVLVDDKKIMQSGTPMINQEQELIDKSGRMTWELMNKVPYTDQSGNVSGIVGVSHDITKFKIAEERMRESEQRLQAFFNNTFALIYIKDTKRRFTMINRQYEIMLNMSNDEVRGKTVFDVFPEESARSYDENDKAVMEQDKLLETEETAVLKDGLHTYLTMKFPLKDAFGNIHSIAGISTDITARTKAEKELQERTKDLERSNRDLEQFAYIASHDLQEPLRMVASYVQLLNRRYKDQLDQNAQEFIAYAVDGVTRMKKLINDLLTYSRVGTHGGDFKKVNCNDVLKQALGNLRFAIEDSEAEIETKELPTIYGDEAQLIQLFQNLIGNAIKFHRDKPKIQVEVKEKKNYVYFSICDNGIGIKDEFKERIFEVFQRLHSRKDYDGTGIGLAVCKKIVERHQGKLWVESEFGSGSTFHFHIRKK